MSELMDNTSTASDACQVFLALYLPLHPVRSRGDCLAGQHRNTQFF